MKKILLILIVVFIFIQFFHPEKNTAADATAFENDISTIYIVPDSVRQVLATACYDCHSNNTQYPWYNDVQPVAWWLSNHIKEGKNALNFSEFASYPIGRQYKKLGAMLKELQSDGMPLSSYTLIHRDAILADDQKNQLINWVTTIRDSIKVNTSSDSLLKK